MTAAELMASFAERTERYLWTDAFAVCNFLGLGQTQRALTLIDRVHHELGRHRRDDARQGWLSGLPDAEAEAHPTAGGLRIGKPLPEDSDDEWERDGQYFHYLTKWMHALDQTTRITGDERYRTWARELAGVAQRRFVHNPRRMYWKMSIDLSAPQVTSMGQHDPLDGYVTSLQLGITSTPYREMIEPAALATADPLGIGGLLVDAYRLHQLDRDAGLRDAILLAARAGLDHFAEHGDLRRPASHRLAFRELGLAIGLSAVERVHVAGFTRFMPLRDAIVDGWPKHRESETYREHQDINDVMLATSLAPDGFLRI